MMVYPWGDSIPWPPEADLDYDELCMTERKCENCGDEVLILSSRDWCDGCELEE